MRNLLFLIILMSCDGKNANIGLEESARSCTVAETENGSLVTCPDGSEVLIVNGEDGLNGQNGADGLDGQNGEDGINSVILSSVLVESNQCQSVGNGVFIENIREGEVFDVYGDSSCSDLVMGNLNEFCDNVQPQFGNSGSIGTGEPGSATVCWVDRRQYSGIRQLNGDILIQILDFN